MSPTEILNACDSLINEHRQVEVLLEALGKALNQKDIQAVRQTMKALISEMNTHFACEEQALFPAVSPYHSMVLMEAEHEALIALRDDLSQAVTEEDWQGIASLGKTFINEMLDHIAREDGGIFPACERSLSATEKMEVIDEMTVIRQAALNSPTPPIQRSARTFKALTIDLDKEIDRPLFSERLENPYLETKHLVIQAGESQPAHWSPKASTLVCMTGLGKFSANADTLELQPGVVISLSPQLTYSLSAETPCHFLVFLST